MEGRKAPRKVTRRRFVAQALAATAAAAFGRMLPRTFAQTTPCAKETLNRIGEIVAHNNRLRGLVTITNGVKRLPGRPSGAQPPMMRYFTGSDLQMTGAPVWPTDKEGLWPGPTLRASVGDHVEITFLNQVKVGEFPGGTLDNAETGATTGCDLATNATLNPPNKNWYPGARGDSFPNCFHGSSTANLHFHGTHVTPDAFGDNVLVQIRPDPAIGRETVRSIFDEVFAKCAQSDQAMPWHDVPASYRNMQEAAVRNYDLHAIWKGVRGPIKDSSGKEIPALPPENQLSPANAKAIATGLWPPYFVGAYPNCFRISPADGHVMGQAPGTHWYHSHKHGSTSINLFNGLAGAFIIEGQYDADLQKTYPNLKKTEKVLVVQVFTDLPNLERAAGGVAAVTTNGTQVIAATGSTPQSAPTIVMRPGEVQLWRIVNAQVQNPINGSFAKINATAPLPAFRQIAQDGVQFKLFNFKKQPLTSPDANGNGTKFSIAAGQRIDILVQAPPSIPAGSTQTYALAGVVNLAVCGTPVNDPWPIPDADYPDFPSFLKDIPPTKIHRELSFDWEPWRINVGPAAQGKTHDPGKTFPIPFTIKNVPHQVVSNNGPYFMIDREQFSEHQYYQTMVLDAEEEWKITNTTIVPHPFHIHVNPFQVVEVHDPNSGGAKFVSETNGVWQDVIAIPSALKDSKGNLVLDPSTGLAKEPGYVRIRSKFVDFPGSFVLHCHILAHEDRGMMQLVRIIPRLTEIPHH